MLITKVMLLVRNSKNVENDYCIVAEYFPYAQALKQNGEAIKEHNNCIACRRIV